MSAAKNYSAFFFLLRRLGAGESEVAAVFLRRREEVVGFFCPSAVFLRRGFGFSALGEEILRMRVPRRR